MTHVGVKRFRTGQRKENAAHDREGDDRISGYEPYGVFDRAERLQIPAQPADVDEFNEPMTMNQTTMTDRQPADRRKFRVR